MSLVDFGRNFDRDFLRRACELGLGCTFSDSAYSVGCVLVSSGGVVLGEGYSRMGGVCDRRHAEEVVISGALGSGGLLDLGGCDLYSSLQPCCRRLSGVVSCQDLILEAGISRVIYGLREPNYFLDHVGDDYLVSRGVIVIYGGLFLEEVRRANCFVERWHEDLDS